jgi:hypothetical protein
MYEINYSSIFGALFSSSDLHLLVFEANHKLSRSHRHNGSSHDGGPSSAVYYLPKDTNQNYVKEGKEPTSLLQYFHHIYGPLLMRISIPNLIYPPTYSITFPRFNHPKYHKENRVRFSKF